MKKILLIFIGCILSNVMIAQVSADDMGVLRIPNKFNDYIYEREIEAFYQGAALDLIVKNADRDVPWVVYSDRNKNAVSDAPSGFKQNELDIG